MREVLKKIILALPLSARTLTVSLREYWWQWRMAAWERKNYPQLPKETRGSHQGKTKNILVYCINGMTYAGTEKNLQVIANGLAETHRVFYMYGDKNIASGRKESMDKRITFIPFSYTNNEVSVPHQLTGMNPHIKEVVAQHEIDLIVTASPGYAHYPWNTITKTPIILLNIFGAPTQQKNIETVIYNSETTKNHAGQWVDSEQKSLTLYAPLAKLPPENVRELGSTLRTKLAIPNDDFVFGRIGRDDDNIFHPIGIRAWQKIADWYPDAHYLIMSPAPALRKIVEEEKIPRVHFLPPSGEESDVWAFHGALDCFAHFRLDGETSGVAIAESLTVGNPVITHRSRIWNAHLEYLTDECSRVADVDNSDEYARYMEEFIAKKNSDPEAWSRYKQSAKQTGLGNFSPSKYIINIRQIIP